MPEKQGAKLKSLIVLNILLGMAAIMLLLQVRKDGGNTLLGYSPSRLGIIIAETFTLMLFTGFAMQALKKVRAPENFTNWLAKLPMSSHITLTLVVFFLFSAIGLIAIALTGRWEKLGILGIFIQRATPFMLWPGTIPILLFFYYHIKHEDGWDKTTLISIGMTNLLAVFMLLDTLLRTQGLGVKRLKLLVLNEILPDFAWIGILLAIIVILHKLSKNSLPTRAGFYVVIRNGLTVFLISTLIYLTSTTVVGHYHTGEQAYAPDLAAALLEGKTYLENSASTVDLTYSNGHWYVPYPPLVALLMLPQAALFGSDNINTVSFSIFFASLNMTLVFMMLEKLKNLGWTNASTNTNVWLTALFGVGTIHWYLAIWGEVWPLNQLTATTFVLIATLLTLYGRPAWLAGLSLGLAILARPHIGLTYPFLFGIFYNSVNNLEFSKHWKLMLKWLVSSTAPLALTVAGIFWYNNLRFGSPLDFGYNASLINIGLFKDELITYGQFNPHFILRNLQVMILGFPKWNSACGFFSANETGMSAFVTTPALIYLYRARKMNSLTIGAWVTVSLFLITLLLHYSTGAMQFGYRFLLDLLTPIMALLGLTLGSAKISLSARALILTGILVNYWGLWWFFSHWCR